MKKIVRIQTGSHLYGTNTPQSDVDWTGVFVPATRDILLGRIPKTSESSPKDDSRKNLAGEEDSTWFSLHHFMNLAIQGQTIAIEMLFAPDSMIKPGEYFYLWEDLREKREAFITKKMKAFIGYARTQAVRYSLKGERLASLKEAKSVLATSLSGSRLDSVWRYITPQAVRVNPNGIKEMQIGGKWFGETTPCSHVLDAVNRCIDRYGKRAKNSTEGVDWKAMSHALRVTWELCDLLTFGEINFPLPYAEILKRVKTGNVSLEWVEKELDKGFERIEKLMSESKLPESVDVKLWENWIISRLQEVL